MLNISNGILSDVFLKIKAKKVSISAPNLIGILLFPFYLVYFLFAFMLFPILSIGVKKPKTKSSNLFVDFLGVIGFIAKLIFLLIVCFANFMFVELIPMTLIIMLQKGLTFFEAIVETLIPVPIIIASCLGFICNIILMIINSKNGYV